MTLKLVRFEHLRISVIFSWVYSIFCHISAGNVESVEEFLKTGDVNTENEDKQTALHVAAMQGY